MCIRDSGTPSSPTLTLDAGILGEVDLTWAFDRYQVVWERDGDLYAAEVSGFNVTTYTVATETAIESHPRIAYDPLGRRSLVIYSYKDDKHYLYKRILQNGEAQERSYFRGFGDNMDPVQLGLSADPANGGWIVAWKESDWYYIYHTGIGMNGEWRGGSGGVFLNYNRRPTLIDLACTQPRPVAQLLLDEDSGTTEFVDSSGFGNDGFCTDDSDYDCPLSGVGGKNENAVQFDGDKDVVFVPLDASESAYAVTLWFKATCQTCGLYEVSNDNAPGTGGYNADRTLYLRNGNVCARLGNRFAKAGGGNTNACGDHEGCEIICSSGVNYGDGNWHQVAHTFGGSVEGQRLYVDGDLQASGTQDSSDLDMGDRLRIGYGEYQYGTYFTGVIDEVTVYPRALSEGEVRDAYRAALAIYSFDETKGSTNFENLAHNGYTASCAGSACPTAGVSGRAYAAAEFDGENDVIRVGNQVRTVAEYVYDFESSVPGEWSHTNRSVTPSEGRTFLGRFGNDTVSLDLSTLPTHDSIEIEFDLFVIGSWDGNATVNDNGPDYWEWALDGGRQLLTTFTNNAPPSYQFYPDEPWSPSSVTIYGDLNLFGPQHRWDFTEDDPDIDPYIYNVTEQNVEPDTVAQLYWSSNYYGSNRVCDGKQYAENDSGCSDFSGMRGESIRVWAAANARYTGASEWNVLGYGQDAVYHILSLIHISEPTRPY